MQSEMNTPGLYFLPIRRWLERASWTGMLSTGRILDESTDNVHIVIGRCGPVHAGRWPGRYEVRPQEGHGRRWLGVLVLMIVLVLGLLATRHLLQVQLDLAGQLIHLRG